MTIRLLAPNPLLAHPARVSAWVSDHPALGQAQMAMVMLDLAGLGCSYQTAVTVGGPA